MAAKPNSEQSFDPERWNACVRLMSRPLETLGALQRTAARVFQYYGRVMNGGHSMHFDSSGDAQHEELLQALREIGALKQSRILTDASILRHEANQAPEEERNSLSEVIEDLDRHFYELKPDIPELLAAYFEAHREVFPQ